MTIPDWYKPIHEHGACAVGLRHAGRYTSYKDLWAKCPRGDWLLWLLGKVIVGRFTAENRQKLIDCAAECACAVAPECDESVGWDVVRRRFPAIYAASQLAEAPAGQWATYAPMASCLPSSAAHEQRVACWEKCADIVRQHYPEPPELLSK